MTHGAPTAPILSVRDLRKSFAMHNRGGATIPVLDRLSFDVQAGECVALNGPSGAGKSTVLRLIYGNYRILGGSILVASEGDTGNLIDIAAAPPREMLALRAHTIGHVSQFLRAVPRVAARDVWDRTTGDLLALQDEIAAAVAEEMQVELTVGPQGRGWRDALVEASSLP